MGWTADSIESYGVIVKDDDTFPDRMRKLREEAGPPRVVEKHRYSFLDEPTAKLRKKRFFQLRPRGEVFVFAYLRDTIYDSGRGLSVPAGYQTSSSNWRRLESVRGADMTVEETRLHELILKHFPEGQLAKFETIVCRDMCGYLQ